MSKLYSAAADPLHIEEIDWKGARHKQSFFPAECLTDEIILEQVQAVPFLKDGQIVLYKHVDGYFGLPGGQVEKDESALLALARELKEECACTLDIATPTFLVKDENCVTGETVFQGRFAAIVDLIDEQVNDPAGKAIGRLAVSVQEAKAKLCWGIRGDILIDRALAEFRNISKWSVD